MRCRPIDAGRRGISRRQLLRGIAAAGALPLAGADAVAAEAANRTRTGFVPPTEADRRQALGSMEGLTSLEKRAFAPADHFTPMPAPAPGEWLAEHEESGQTFEQFVRSRPPRPASGARTLYLLPFGEFDPEWSPKPADLEAVAAAFFQLPVKTLPPRSLDDLPVAVRERKPGWKQYLSTDFLRLLKGELPKDGFCIVGVTLQDLYPDPKWNYVFGQASLRDRVGIYSFARYDPRFWGEPRTPAAKSLLLVRSLGVLLHETSHIFGMQHCVYYRCLVNGSNSLTESDQQPLRLCPVCLRKLRHSVGFDLVKRDEALRRDYRRLELKSEAEWLDRRLSFVNR